MLLNKIKTSLAESKQEPVKKNILKVIIGETQRFHTEPTNKQVEGIIRKIIESNKETLRYKDNEQLRQEIVVMEELLPKQLTLEELRSYVTPDILGDGGGQAIGRAIKHLNGLGLSFDNKDVATLIKEYGENNGTK